jgi:hypothetical protein
MSTASACATCTATSTPSSASRSSAISAWAVRRAGRHQPAARRPRHARMLAGRDARCRQGRLPALHLADPDHRPRRAQRPAASILYADQMTGSMTRAIAETDRRREKQVAYNRDCGGSTEKSRPSGRLFCYVRFIAARQFPTRGRARPRWCSARHSPTLQAVSIGLPACRSRFLPVLPFACPPCRCSARAARLRCCWASAPWCLHRCCCRRGRRGVRWSRAASHGACGRAHARAVHCWLGSHGRP